MKLWNWLAELPFIHICFWKLLTHVGKGSGRVWSNRVDWSPLDIVHVKAPAQANKVTFASLLVINQKTSWWTLITITIIIITNSNIIIIIITTFASFWVINQSASWWTLNASSCSPFFTAAISLLINCYFQNCLYHCHHYHFHHYHLSNATISALLSELRKVTELSKCV